MQFAELCEDFVSNNLSKTHFYVTTLALLCSDKGFTFCEWKYSKNVIEYIEFILKEIELSLNRYRTHIKNILI